LADKQFPNLYNWSSTCIYHLSPFALIINLRCKHIHFLVAVQVQVHHYLRYNTKTYNDIFPFSSIQRVECELITLMPTTMGLLSTIGAQRSLISVRQIACGWKQASNACKIFIAFAIYNMCVERARLRWIVMMKYMQ
jgi:hypothetical protein